MNSLVTAATPKFVKQAILTLSMILWLWTDEVWTGGQSSATTTFPVLSTAQGYLEEVASAISRAWRMPRMKTMGFFLVMKK